MPTRWIPALLAAWTWTLASLVAWVLLVSALGIETGLILGIAEALVAIAVGATVGRMVFTRSADSHDSLSWPGRIVLFTGATAFVSIWAHQAWVAWRRPVYDWDGLYYHLPAVHGWLRAGRIAWLEGHDIPFVNGYPMAVETLGFWGVRVLGTPPSALHFVIMGLRPIDTNLTGVSGVAPGCFLRVDTTNQFLGVLPVRIGSTATWALPLPETLTPATIYLQGFYTGPTGEFQSTRRLAVPVVR